MIARRTAPAAIAALLAAVLLTVTVGSTPAAAAYRQSSQLQATLRWLAHPASSPAGVDPASCHVSAAHPRPVILLPGIVSRVSRDFGALGPRLANDGLCVYGLNYGDTVLTTLSGGRAGGLGDIVASATLLAARVADVRRRTGAATVDLVGYSEGGLVAREYLAQGGTAAHLVMLGTPNHGTDASGLYTLLRATGLVTVLGALETAGGFSALDAIGCDACDQVLTGSAFLTALNTHGPGGVTSTVVFTRYALVDTPGTNQGLAGARNLLLQAACPHDATTDLALPYDPVAQQYVEQGLGLAAVGPPTCS